MHLDYCEGFWYSYIYCIFVIMSFAMNMPNVSVIFILKMFFIMIVSVTGTPAFRGILLQARTNEEGRATGTWAAPASENYKLMECNSQSSSALTHANSGEKSNPEFSWNPPEVLNSTSFTF